MCFVLVCVFVIHSKMSTYSFTAVSTPSGNCSDGELRLVGGSDNVQTGTREGRVEICINNAWGTICNNLFRKQDAGVVCEQLEGFQRDGKFCIHMAFDMLINLLSATLLPMEACEQIFMFTPSS